MTFCHVRLFVCDNLSVLTVFFDFFFFKQKTAYEIGLGIPAEPLFRSAAELFAYTQGKREQFSGFNRTLDAINNVFRKFSAFHRSEERRVGKECRSRWSRDH